MRVLFWGLFIFSVSFFFHVFIWRISLPKRQIKSLLQLFFGMLIIVFFIMKFILPYFENLKLLAPINLVEYIHVFLFFVSLTSAYVITYSAIESDSPSLLIVNTIAEAGYDGLNKERLEEVMTDDSLLVPRINDLVNDKMVYLKQNKYKLTPKGELFVKTFVLYRKMLNLEKGG